MEPVKLYLDLAGDFHDDIRGKAIRLSNPEPKDRNQTLGRKGTYMEGLASMQRGNVGDITAGIQLGVWTEDLAQEFIRKHELLWTHLGTSAGELEKQRPRLVGVLRKRIRKQEPYYPYVSYPYIEWYSDANGRVVLELYPEQVEIVDSEVQPETGGEPSFEERIAESTAASFFRRFLGERLGDAKTSQPDRLNE